MKKRTGMITTENPDRSFAIKTGHLDLLPTGIFLISIMWSPTDKPVAPVIPPAGRNLVRQAHHAERSRSTEQRPPAKTGACVEGSKSSRRLIIKRESFIINHAGGMAMVGPDRFIADTMLGKLARWLRILGYDTLYYRDIQDYALLQIAYAQHRWLLTRDTVMLRERKPLNCTFVRHDRLQDQLRQVVMELGLKADHLLMRCLECNEVLLDLPRIQAQPLVPEYVYQTQTRFSQCPICQRVYWAGTHYERICKRLEDLFSQGPNSEDRTCRPGG